MNETLDREKEFHDRLADRLDPERMPERALEDLEIALLERIGDVKGKRLLELGCGAGDLTLVFARLGADVTALDLSPGMVEVAKRRVETFSPGATVRFLVEPAEQVSAEAESFDLIVGKWILHHTDLSLLTPELKRLLAPGGRALFIENSGLNPILRFARERVIGRFGIRRVGTADEHPLVDGDYELFESAFTQVRRIYPQFDFLKLLDRQVFRYRRPRVTRVCFGFDRFVERRVPALHRYSFRVIVELAR